MEIGQFYKPRYTMLKYLYDEIITIIDFDTVFVRYTYLHNSHPHLYNIMDAHMFLVYYEPLTTKESSLIKMKEILGLP